MDLWPLIIWGGGALLVLAAIYGLHRLCLRLEDRGWIYYLHKKPTSTAIGSMMGMHQIIEPQSKHIYEMKEERRPRAEEGAPGEKEPNSPSSPTEDPSS